MNIKVFTLRFNDVEGKFDDSELTAFGGDPNHPRDVVDVSEHFFIHDRSPTWIMLVMYKDVPKPGARPDREERKDWRADLDALAKALFDELNCL